MIERLTRETHDRLAAELADLTTRGRIDIARKIEVARELGDLSENGDYHAAKEEQGKMEGRILHLESVLLDAEIVEKTDGDVVAPGSVVSIAYGDDEDIETYLVGSIEERHDKLDVISPKSPLGEALLGSAVGDQVSYESPAGKLNVRIVSIDV